MKNLPFNRAKRTRAELMRKIHEWFDSTDSGYYESSF